MKDSKKINVYIISGFLGSGKTTLLNNLLRQFNEEKNVVIENEFGKINIDSTLINGSFDYVYELTNGCICCSMNNSLLETLTRIVTGEKRPDNLFIETTGIADAGEIAATFTSFFVAEEFCLKKIVTVVDAENILFYKDSNTEVQKQVVAADIVVINKYGLVETEILTEIKGFIQAINPYANISLSNKSSLERLNLTVENRRITSIPARVFNSENVHKIKTVLYETDYFFDIQKLKYEIFRNLYLYYHQVYRIKGYVLNSDNKAFLVQTTGKTVIITPAEKQLVSRSQLVFIGKQLELKTAERITKSALIKNKRLQLL